MSNLKWKGEGYCQGRHIRKENDYCNNTAQKGHGYCWDCECQIGRCKEKWGSYWPFLGVRLCSKHNHLKGKWGAL